MKNKYLGIIKVILAFFVDLFIIYLFTTILSVILQEFLLLLGIENLYYLIYIVIIIYFIILQSVFNGNTLGTRMVKNIGNKDSNLQSKKHKNIIVFTLLLLTLLFNLIFFDPGFNMNNTSVNAYRLNILKNTIESKFGISNVSIKSEIRDKDGITRFKSVGIDPTPNNINTKLKNNLIVSGYIKYSLFESSAYLGDDIIQDIQYNYPEITDYNNIIVRIRTGYNAGLYKYYIAQEIEFDITDYIFNTYGK